MSAIFFHDADQEQAARKTLREQEQRHGQRVHTEIAPTGTFFRAEDYHQKYRLRRAGHLLGELEAIYPRTADLVDSTAAARMNGFVAGCGTRDQLQEELPSYGLSPDGQRLLLKLFDHQHRRRRP